MLDGSQSRIPAHARVFLDLGHELALVHAVAHVGQEAAFGLLLFAEIESFGPSQPVEPSLLQLAGPVLLVGPQGGKGPGRQALLMATENEGQIDLLAEGEGP